MTEPPTSERAETAQLLGLLKEHTHDAELLQG